MANNPLNNKTGNGRGKKDGTSGPGSVDGQVLTRKHGVEVRTPGGQNHPVSADLHVLRHDGHVAQQTLAVNLKVQC